MNNILQKVIACVIVFNLFSGDAACPAYVNGYALRSKASANASVSRDMAERFLSNDIQGAEDGIAFAMWDKNPDILAFGEYANLQIISGGLTAEDTAILNSRLKNVKGRLLKEGFLDEEDFNVGIRVVYRAYKSATYDRKTDIITLDRRSFENEDFLYLSIRHELTDRKLPNMDIIGGQFKEHPGLRELFTLITVNIAGFISLRRNHIRRAQNMLEHYRSIVHYNNGLFRCYERIMRDPSLNDPFAFTEDIFRLVENRENKVYFPNMREAVRKLAVKKADGSINYEQTSSFLKMRLRHINNQFLEMQNVGNRPKLRPLTDFKARVPESLKPFMPYAKSIDYELDGDCIFLRVRLNNSRDNPRFAYIYIGLNDKWDSVLGKRGKVYGLTYDKWQAKSPGIFQYRHDGIEKDRRIYWGRLIRLPITKLINKLYDDSSQDRLRGLFISLFNELGVKDALSSKKWFSIRKLIRTGKAPGTYYVINNIIWRHIDRVYPKLFFRERSLQDTSLADMPAWLVMEDPNINSDALSWLNPRKKRGTLSFYEQAERISMRDILSMLQDAYPQGVVFPVSSKASQIYIMQNIQTAIHTAA